VRLAGDAELVVVNFLEGTNGEELVTAGDAAVGGHPEEALESGSKAGDMLWGDAFEVVIAADGAVRGKAVGKRGWPAAKARATPGAPPWQASDQGRGKIRQGASARPTAGRRMAGGTNHQRCPLSDLGLRRY
jgi:hypothetical protein